MATMNGVVPLAPQGTPQPAPSEAQADAPAPVSPPAASSRGSA